MFNNFNKENKSLSVRPSFREAINIAKEQVEFECIENNKEQANELCFIIAEVYLMREDSKVRINGEFLDGCLVQEVFKELNNGHIELVIQKFNQITYTVNNKKAYLRASLYNAVFECDSYYANAVNVDLYGNK